MAKGFNGLMNMAKEEAILQFGSDFNTSETGNWYKLISSFILIAAYLEDKFIALKSDRNIYTAKGRALDDMFSNDLVFRIQGARAKGKATVTGEDKTVITERSIEVKSTNDLIYTNTNAGTINGSTIELEFECTTLGSAGNIPVSNFKSVQKAPYGVRDVQNNSFTMSGGLDTEPDFEYLKRYLATIKDKDWSLPAVLAAIRQLNGVVSCDGIRNNTYTDGVNGIPRKSVKIVVDGGDEQEIAQTMYNKIHTADTVGDIKKQIEMAPGNFTTISFSRPKTTKIDYQYTIISAEKEKILKLLVEYLNETKVGDIVSDQEFRNKKIDSYLQGITTVISITFKKQSEMQYKPFIQLDYSEKGSAGNGSEAS